MSTHENLRQLAARDAGAAPFDFDVFEQRRAAAVARRRTSIASAVASVAVLGLVSVIALLTQSPAASRLAGEVAPLVRPAAAATVAAPALIDLDQFDLTVELEDHIAALDDQLSAARQQAVPAARLQQLESTREQLNNSLQRVSYAHSLMSL
jgi:hypothetical protein